MAEIYVPVAQLVNILGMAGALKLAASFGSSAMYIPSADKLKEDHKLVLAVGMVDARRLAKEFPSQGVTFPSMAAERKRVQDERIVRLSATMTAVDIANQERMTARNVFRILREHREALDARPTKPKAEPVQRAKAATAAPKSVPSTGGWLGSIGGAGLKPRGA